MGFPRLWRYAEGQLGGLVRNVSHPVRRQLYANSVRHIHILPDDMILADDRGILETLDFPRLESVHMYLSHLDDVRSANLDALIVPTLRSMQLEEDEDDWMRERLDRRENASDTFLNALMTICTSLTTLTLPSLPESAEPLILDLLGRLTAIEHLDLELTSQTLVRYGPPEVLLEKLLDNKPRLTTISFPPSSEFHEDVLESFLRRVGNSWSLPSLRSISPGRNYGRPMSFSRSTAPVLGCSMAAARIIDAMPSMEHLHLGLFVESVRSAADLRHVLTSISSLRHLRTLDLEIWADIFDVDGEIFVQLGNLANAETFALHVHTRDRDTFPANGAQLAALLAGSPNLKKLELRLDMAELPCSPEAKTAIDAAIATIEKVDLNGLIFVTQDAPPPPPAA